MKTKPVAIFLVITCTILTTVGQFFLKKGASIEVSNPLLILFNIMTLVGLVSYGLGLIFMIYALKNGELSVIYPFVSLSFIWVALVSLYVLNETITIYRWTGIILIIGGISFIGIGGKK